MLKQEVYNEVEVAMRQKSILTVKNNTRFVSSGAMLSS